MREHKNKYYHLGTFLFGAVMATLALGLSGCDSFKTASSSSQGKTVVMADGRTVVVKDASEKKLRHPGKNKFDAKSAKKNNKKSNKVKGSQAQLSSDRQAIDSPESIESNISTEGNISPVSDTTSVEIESGLTEVAIVPDEKVKNEQSDNEGIMIESPLNGEWVIYSVRGNLVTGEERPYINFDMASSRFYGNNGCNIINGDLVLNGEGSIKFENVISTMKMCRDDQMQYLINLALNDVTGYSVRNDKREVYLDLMDANKTVILVLRRHNMDFLNGAWKVVSLNGSPLVQDDDASMTFDTSELKIHGTTGCNIFNGDLFIDPDKTESLQIIGLRTTRMGCPPDSRETEFLIALEGVESARPLGDSTVGLFSQEGKMLFKLTKMELRDGSEAE